VTPNKLQSSNASILKTKTNSASVALSNKIESTKSVKFKLIKMLTNNEDIDENMDIGSTTSSVMSTISSKSVMNLHSRLNDLQKDEENLENAVNLKNLIESDATSCLFKKKNQSLCSINSTISIQSSANLCKRLNDLEADVKDMEQSQRKQKIKFDLDYDDQVVSSKPNIVPPEPAVSEILNSQPQSHSSHKDSCSTLCIRLFF
jgi:hypothetical protein